MKKIPAMTDMSIKPVEIENVSLLPAGFASSPDMPMYPYGLRLTFDQGVLDKLKLNGDCAPGDMIYLDCMAKVIGVYKNDTVMTSSSSVELQIISICTESEEEEAEEAEEEVTPFKPKNPYKK